jgi:5-methylcytosine-specific restriction endonuclease McrA
MLRADALIRDGGVCVVEGCKQPATRVDHIVARKDGGLDALSNLRSLCGFHDNQAHREKGGGGGSLVRRSRFTNPGADCRGWPIDPMHPWNR